MMPNGNQGNGRFAPPQDVVPARVLTGMINQSGNRVRLFGELGHKLRAAHHDLQVNCQQISMAAASSPDPHSLARLQAYYKAAQTRIANIFQALEGIAQLEIEWQGEAQRWLAGMPPSLLDAPAQQPMQPMQQQQMQAMQAMMQQPPMQPMQPMPQHAVGAQPSPQPGMPGMPGMQRNGVPPGAMPMPLASQGVMHMPGVGGPAQPMVQPVLTQPQGGMVSQVPLQQQGLPTVQFGSPQEAALAAAAAQAAQMPLAPVAPVAPAAPVVSVAPVANGAPPVAAPSPPAASAPSGGPQPS